MTLFALFILLLVFSFLDMVISGLALEFGATEVGLLYQISGDWQLTCFIKGIATFLFGLILVAYDQKKLLAISAAILFGICLFDSMILLFVQ